VSDPGQPCSRLKQSSLLLAQIETAAFLPVSVSLSAICARLRMLFDELRSTVQISRAACQSIQPIIALVCICYWQSAFVSHRRQNTVEQLPIMEPVALSEPDPDPPLRPTASEDTGTEKTKKSRESTSSKASSKPTQQIPLVKKKRKTEKPRDAIDDIFGF
jgi:hypothetical protein